MIDFTILSGEQFEDMCEDLFKAMGYNDPPPERSGRGPDAGRDIIVTELRKSGVFDANRRTRWLVECKNFARSNRSVQPKDIGSVTDKLILHRADAYLLVTTTLPSINVEKTIRAVDGDRRLGFEAAYWARQRVEDELLKHRQVYEKYFGSPVPAIRALTHWTKGNPFVELFPYEEALARSFFGRESDITSVVERVYRNSHTMLYGESGVGKTSLIQAGILPVLRNEGFRVVNLVVTPSCIGESLLSEVESAVADLQSVPGSATVGQVDSLDERFCKVAESLSVLGQRLVVVQDQFEAAFQSDSVDLDELGRVLASLSALAQKYRNISFLLCIRSDYLDDLGIWVKEHNIPEIWRNSYPVEKLKASQATIILHSTAKTANAEFSGGCANAIVNDLLKLDGGRVYPPNLQIVASRVFDVARSRADPQNDNLAIELEDYESAGGTEGILASFLDERLTDFGPERDTAHKALLALVSATGRRVARSEDELAEQLSEPLENVRQIVDKLIGVRLVKPADGPGVFELVHDVLALKVLKATEEEIRKEKEANEAFELAVKAWLTDGVSESKGKLDWFFQYKHCLSIGSNELFFLLFSETGTYGDSVFGSLLRTRSRRLSDRRLRWIEFAAPDVCVEVVDSVLDSLSPTASDDNPLVEILGDLFRASHFGVQRELVARLREHEKSSPGEIIRNVYRTSPIPSSACLGYLQDIVLDDLPGSAGMAIAWRLLAHYQSTFPGMMGLVRISDDPNEWTARFPIELLDDEAFRTVTFEFLEAGPDRFADRSAVSRFRIELFKLLHDRDPDKTLEAMWNSVRPIRYIDRYDIQVIMLLRIYDAEATIEEVVRELSREKRFHSERSTVLLEALEAPEADDLLVKDLERYAKTLTGGSKRWRGGALPYWRKCIRKTVQAVTRRRLQAAVPFLRDIVLGYETVDVKMDSVHALVTISGEDAIDILVELLDDRSAKVRNCASKHLLEMERQRRRIAQAVVRSITEQDARKRAVHQGSRTDVLRRKINTLGKMHAVEAIGVLEELAANDRDENVRKSAARVEKALKKAEMGI